ncbi:MAG TPA: DinB family protein [Blastocatellia bacterium]|nr:DinB family protein [Blastocatellia bacterium]
MRTYRCLMLTMILGVSTQVFAQPRSGQAETQSKPATAGGAMTPEERASLVELLTKTKEEFIESIRGLSDAQWRFKPTPWKWSVAETAEHIILSEDYIFGFSQQVLKGPAQPRSANSVPEKDQALEAIVTDRSKKVLNPDALKPTDRFKTPDEAIAEFTARRDRHIEYVRTTNDELRAHVAPANRIGRLDAYQLIVLVGSHSGRHTAQIREVESDPHYPSK